MTSLRLNAIVLDSLDMLIFVLPFSYLFLFFAELNLLSQLFAKNLFTFVVVLCGGALSLAFCTWNE